MLPLRLLQTLPRKEMDQQTASLERIRQIVTAADGQKHGRPEALDYPGRRTRVLVERQGWTTVQISQAVCLVLPGGERMLQVRGFGHKSLVPAGGSALALAADRRSSL